MKKIGVLALQGAFAEHIAMLSGLGAETTEIRQKSHLLQSLDGIILPGGESTVIGKLLRELKMFGMLKAMIEKGLPVMGTCAGLILLAKTIENDTRTHLETMDITVKRNAYGRQLGSFTASCTIKGIGETKAVFIRAPQITAVGTGCEVLAEVDGKPVAVKQGKQLALTFHPELSDEKVHKYFLEEVAS
jgi:5'-phosphate synthase pdxT subunit